MLWLGNDALGVPLRVPLATLPHLLVVGVSGAGKSRYLSEAVADLAGVNPHQRPSVLLIAPDTSPYDGVNEAGALRASPATTPADAVALLRWVHFALAERLGGASGWLGVADRPNLPILAASDEANGASVRAAMLLVIDGYFELLRVAPDVAELVGDLTAYGRRVGVHVIASVPSLAPGPQTDHVLRQFPARLVLRTGTRADSELLLGGDAASAFQSQRDAAFVNPMKAHEAPLRLRIDGSPQPAGEFDELLPVVVELARTEGSVDSRTVQTLCDIGYGRAARILDQLVSLGVLRASGEAPIRYTISQSAPSDDTIRWRIDRARASTSLADTE